ncbi:MAG: TolC family protein [Deltaproteobacteria bacterium]|nr:TolC family protein [Deltaproteobacteria bacterium]
MSPRGRVPIAPVSAGRWRVVSGLSAGVLALGVSTSTWADVPTPKRMTLTEAIDASLVSSPVVKIAAAGISAQESKVSATRALLFPRLRVEGNVFVWNDKLPLSLGPQAAQPAQPAQSSTISAPAAPVAGAEEQVIREQVTASLSITAVEPITGLYAITRLIALEEAGLDAGIADQETARLDTAQRVAQAYFGLLSARALTEVAEKSLSQVEAQHARARVLESAGVLGRVDLLRLDSVRESVKQGLLLARMGRDLASRGLVLAIGAPLDQVLEPVDDFPDPPPSFELPESGVRELAEHRSELVAARARLEQARGGTDVAKAALFPSIVAIASYQHTEGQSSIFTPADTFFGGATLTWDVFEWGRTMHTIDEAGERARQAELGVSALENQIRFDVERRLLEAKTASDTLSAARAGLVAAEEAHRIQSVRFEQGAATTTDVIDAETDLARARSQSATARYNYYLSLANAARALGRLPEVTSKEIRP